MLLPFFIRQGKPVPSFYLWQAGNTDLSPHYSGLQLLKNGRQCHKGHCRLSLDLRPVGPQVRVELAIELATSSVRAGPRTTKPLEAAYRISDQTSVLYS